MLHNPITPPDPYLHVRTQDSDLPDPDLPGDPYEPEPDLPDPDLPGDPPDSPIMDPDVPVQDPVIDPPADQPRLEHAVEALDDASADQDADQDTDKDGTLPIRPAGPEGLDLPPEDWDETDEEIDESFPASDPPGNY